jgi:aspartyl-tRNA(Asn)/glutamyl-tRNA(Gln) amidotransferase subunit C
MPLTPEEVLHIARLARLHVDEQEVSHYARELTVILDYVAQLSSVDTSSVESSSSVVLTENVLRDDLVTPSLNRDIVLLGAPLHDGVFFMVPKVIGG